MVKAHYEKYHNSKVSIFFFGGGAAAWKVGKQNKVACSSFIIDAVA